MPVKARLAVAAILASLLWMPHTTQATASIYCYPGDPPDVYQACLAYNAGIQQQVDNQYQLNSIQHQINNTVAQINAIDTLIVNINKEIATQQKLIAQTQATIDDLSRQIRFGEANLLRLRAHVAVRDQLLNARIRYVDEHGSVNYVELVLTASNLNQMMNRLIGAQQIAASDKQLLSDLQEQHVLVTEANNALSGQRAQVSALLQQQQAEEADMQKNLKVQQAAIAFELQLEAVLSSQYAAVEAQRHAIDAEVAALDQKYQAAAAKYGGGSGVFEWPEPSCNFSCISQGFGCSPYYFEAYAPQCPWPHTMHLGIDIAGPGGTQIVAADTGIVYLFPNGGPYSWTYGNLAVMFHGNGYETRYAHMASFAPGLRSGDVVGRGTTIGFEGSTGNSTGPHLHFEIRLNDYPKDPCIWLGC